jgi:hypothetical protein
MVAWLAVPGLAAAWEPLAEAEPETRIVRGPPRLTANRLAVFEFESDAAGATFECSLEGGRFFPCESPLRLYARIQLGQSYTLKVKATLKADTGETLREDSTPAVHAWRTLDQLPWQPVITEPVPGALMEPRVLRVAGLAMPGAMIRVLLNDEPVAVTRADAQGEWALMVRVENGPYTLFAELEDGAGEALSFTELVPFTVQAPEPGGCSSTGSSPVLLLIGLVVLAIANGRPRCRQESRVSSRGCSCCR